MTRDQNRALKELCKDDSIVILPAEKGKAVVVMDAPKYQRKIDDILSDDRYTMLSKDPTKKLEAKLSKILMNLDKISELPSELRRRLTPAQSYTPQPYGLPKIHEEEIPLRPIVSTISSPCYLVAKHLARILTPLVGCNLFTMVPVDEIIPIVRKKLEEDENLEERSTLTVPYICQLIKLCLKSTFFHQNGRFWEQKDGVAMGSLLSPIAVDLFMESFEQEALNSANDKPKLWVQYVDDTFVIWQHGLDKLELFQKHLNNIKKSIKFTMEVETEVSYLFLMFW